MNERHRGLGAVLLGLVCAMPVSAQETEEIVVTAMRRNEQGPPPLPAVTIRKRGDSLLQAVQITNDSRDAKQRAEELYATLRGLLQAAKRTPGLSLAWQRGFLIPLTDKDYRIPLADGDDRDDTNTVTVFLRYQLTPQTDVASAVAVLERFTETAKMEGRSDLEPLGDVALSIVNPERYRPELIAALAANVRELKKAFGDTCEVNVGNFAQRLQWQRSDVSELTLYLPYSLTVEGC